MNRKPNFIFILADDMGIGDVSAFNPDSKIKTVNFDRLASEGIAFTDAHSSSAVCTPSRYSILTGRYNWRSALKSGVLFGYDTPLIEDGRMTVASMLKDEGYKTACIGKWHLGLEWTKCGEGKCDLDFSKPLKKTPNDYGFDYFFGISGSLDMDPYVYIENNRVTAEPDRITEGKDPKAFWRKGPTGADFVHEQVLPTLTGKVKEKINEYRDSPFFIYFPMPAPHTPILPTPEFAGKSGTNEYGDFVLMCDDAVGQVVECLKENGLYDNTVIIFSSDNGVSPSADLESLKKMGHNSSYVYRGHKADIYEGGHRIPLIVSWGEELKKSFICDDTVCLCDFMATVADITGYSLPDNAGEDSVSNLPVWHGEKLDSSLREATVHQSIDGSYSIRKGDWKLEFCPGSGGWSYPQPGKEPENSPPMQLYRLNDDIGERKNLIADYPEITQELTELIKKYIADGRSTPGNPQNNTDGENDDWLYLFKQ